MVMTSEAAKELRTRREEVIARHFNAENRHDAEAIVASFDEPRFDVVPLEETFHGAATLREIWEGFLEAFPDLRMDPGRPYHADDAVFLEVAASGTHRGAWAGLDPTDRSFSVRVGCLFEFEEDRLIGERIYFDLATILRQLWASSNLERQG